MLLVKYRQYLNLYKARYAPSVIAVAATWTILATTKACCQKEGVRSANTIGAFQQAGCGMLPTGLD